ncbi:hypothetical protein KKH42_00630, partial [bacterium]|nr:hypothetical protein [bacterium]
MSNRVITLLDSWDTLGQTLTEISVAMASANQLNEEVALVNLNFYAQPILHGFFNVTPEKSVADVFPVLSRLDGKMLKGFCA